MHKSKIMPTAHLTFIQKLLWLYLAKHTLLLISMLHFWMCNILKFTQNKSLSTYSIVAYLFTTMLCEDYYIILI